MYKMKDILNSNAYEVIKTMFFITCLNQKLLEHKRHERQKKKKIKDYSKSLDIYIKIRF